MSLTQSVWTQKTVNGFLVITCTVIATTGEADAYTLKTPAGTIDGRRPFTVFLQCSANPDANAALPVEIAIGHADNFVVGSTDTIGLVSGSIYKEIVDDCVTALSASNLEFAFLIHPDLGVADVITESAIATGLKANVPPAPYYAFNLASTTALDAHTATWRVVQKL